MLEPSRTYLSVRTQCELLGIARSGLYYAQAVASEQEVLVKEVLVEEHLKAPMYGARKLAAVAHRKGYPAGRKLVGRLMNELGIKAISPCRRVSLSGGGKNRRRYPYLLRGVTITRPNQAWATDITYLRLESGFVYLVALIDLQSRYIVGWTVSTSLDAVFCIETLRQALRQHGTPEIVNMDQGTQFTSDDYLSVLEGAGVRISMDGKGRVFDNILIERFWRTVKYEEVYLKRYESVSEAREAIGEYIRFYNEQRVHQALAYQTPDEVYHAYEAEAAA